MVMGVGALLMLIGAIWMIYLAVTTEQTTGGKILWALLIFFFAPIGATIYFLLKKVGLVPLILIWVAVLFYGFGIMSGTPIPR